MEVATSSGYGSSSQFAAVEVLWNGGSLFWGGGQFVGGCFGSLQSCLVGVYCEECSGGGGDAGSGGDSCGDRNSSSGEGEIGDNGRGGAEATNGGLLSLGGEGE